MDLNTLETWARHTLEAEAARRGVRDPHLRSRVELVRLILQRASLRPLQRGRRRVSEGLSKLSEVRKALDAAVEATAAILPPSVRPLFAHREEDTWKPSSVAPPARAAAAVSMAPKAAPSERESSAREPAAEAAVMASAPEVTPASLGVTEVGVPSMVWTNADPTHDMAAEDSVQWQSEDEQHARVHYRVSGQGIARAQAVLGGPGELSVRMVAALPDRETLVRTEAQEHGPVSESGTFTVGPLGPTTHCVVALGLRDGGRFVSIAHATVGSFVLPN